MIWKSTLVVGLISAKLPLRTAARKDDTGPIFTIRFCRMRQVYDRLRYELFRVQLNLQLAYDCYVSQKNCRGILKHV